MIHAITGQDAYEILAYGNLDDLDRTEIACLRLEFDAWLTEAERHAMFLKHVKLNDETLKSLGLDKP